MVKDCYKTLGYKKAEEFPEHFALADQICELANIILDNLGKRNLKLDAMELHQVILLYIYFKALNSFLSVMVLCDRGLVGDAKSCCRKLIEMMISMKYMMDDREKRQHQYFYHLPIAIIKDFGRVSRSPELHSQKVIDMIKERENEVDEWVEQAKKHYEINEEGEIVGKFKRNWSGKTVAEMAKACGLEFAYVNPYVLYSRSTHASADDMSNYCCYQDAAFGQNFEHDDIPSVIIEAVRAYWLLSACVADAFDMKLTGSLKRILKRFQDLEKLL